MSTAIGNRDIISAWCTQSSVGLRRSRRSNARVAPPRERWHERGFLSFRTTSPPDVSPVDCAFCEGAGFFIVLVMLLDDGYAEKVATDHRRLQKGTNLNRVRAEGIRQAMS